MLVGFLRTSDFILAESRKLANMIARQTPNFVCDVISLSGKKKNVNMIARQTPNFVIYCNLFV